MWLGYDRLPQLSVVGDGPLIQDPALALARGQGMSAPSFAGMLNWEIYMRTILLFICLYSQSCLEYLGSHPLRYGVLVFFR